MAEFGSLIGDVRPCIVITNTQTVRQRWIKPLVASWVIGAVFGLLTLAWPKAFFLLWILCAVISPVVLAVGLRLRVFVWGMVATAVMTIPAFFASAFGDSPYGPLIPTDTFRLLACFVGFSALLALPASVCFWLRDR